MKLANVLCRYLELAKTVELNSPEADDPASSGAEEAVMKGVFKTADIRELIDECSLINARIAAPTAKRILKLWLTKGKK